MSNPRSLSFQASCIRDVLSEARTDDIRAGLEAAIRTIEWIEKGEAVVRMLVAMRRERPDMFRSLAGLLNAFPDAQPEDIRRVA